jgi:hypothetical protein
MNRALASLLLLVSCWGLGGRRAGRGQRAGTRRLRCLAQVPKPDGSGKTGDECQKPVPSAQAASAADNGAPNRDFWVKGDRRLTGAA